MIVTSEIARIAQTLLKDSTFSLVEANWQSLTPLNLTPGQMVRGDVMANLANSRYLVRLANQMLQMELPINLQPGETVDLTFVTQDPRLVFALSKSENSGVPVQISDTGRWLNNLSQEGTPGLTTTSLPRISTILTAPPRDTNGFASLLRNALGRSGVFYESHLAEWVGGERPLTDILQEPQGSLSPLAKNLVTAEVMQEPPIPATPTAAPAPSGTEPRAETAQTAGQPPPSPSVAQESPKATGQPAPPSATQEAPQAEASVPPSPGGNAPTTPSATAAPEGKAQQPAAPSAGNQHPSPQVLQGERNVTAAGLPVSHSQSPSQTQDGTPPQPAGTTSPSANAGESPPLKTDTAPAPGASSQTPTGSVRPDAPLVRETVVSPPQTHDERAFTVPQDDKQATVADKAASPHRHQPAAELPAQVSQPAGKAPEALAAEKPSLPPATPPQLRIEPQTIPLIKEQLAVLTSGEFTWLGQVWPDQMMEWKVQERDARSGSEEERSWRTELQLDLPNLGEIKATLHLSLEGVTATVRASDPDTVGTLKEKQGKLQQAMESAGIRVGGIVVRHGEE